MDGPCYKGYDVGSELLPFGGMEMITTILFFKHFLL